MRNLELYIENHLIEIDDDVTFAISKQFESVANPTTLYNDWSKTVNIPFTANNNQVFGHLYEPERMAATDGTSDVYKRMGIYFDPTKKLDFLLTYCGSPLMSGYAKMTTIRKTNGKGVYEITLFGALGKAIGELRKITFDESSSDVDYVIDGSQYVNEVINKELVNDAWRKTNRSHNLDNSDWSDIIGFAVAHKGFNEEFESETVQMNYSTTSGFTDILAEDEAFKATHIDPQSVAGEGLMPNVYREYRSYYQPPFVYFDSLFYIFQRKAESVTGYKFELDENWFNTYNPYFAQLCYMLKPLDIKGGARYQNNYNMVATGAQAIFTGITPTNRQIPPYYNFYSLTQNEYVASIGGVRQYNETVPMINQSDWRTFESVSGKSVERTVKGVDTWTLTLSDPTRELNINGQYRLNAGVSFVIRYKLIFSNGTVLYCNRIIQDYNISNMTRYKKYAVADFDIQASPYIQMRVNVDYYFNIPPELQEYSFVLDIELEAIDEFGAMTQAGNNYTTGTITLTKSIANPFYVSVDENRYRSNAIFTLNELWNNEYNIFDEILRYCKIFRIGIFVDDVDKTIKFQRLSTYFSDYKIIDWSDKVDFTRDFEIQPLTFEHKYVIFNYAENNTKLGQQYREKYGREYGEKVINTNYNFDSEDELLFDDEMKTSIVSSEAVMDWTKLFNGNIVYVYPSEIMPSFNDKDNKIVDFFGSWFFDREWQYANTDLRTPIISDDSYLMKINDIYTYINTFYTDENIQLSTDKLKYLDIVDVNGNVCLFNVPLESYTRETNYNKSITDNFWHNYLNERYNINNKLITCYIKLSPVDYMNFSYNQFVKIGEQIYMVNKIIDYDIQSNRSTQVELVSVTDLNGYCLDEWSKIERITDSLVVTGATEGTEYVTVKTYNNIVKCELIATHSGNGSVSVVQYDNDRYEKRVLIEYTHFGVVQGDYWEGVLRVHTTSSSVDIPVYIS